MDFEKMQKDLNDYLDSDQFKKDISEYAVHMKAKELLQESRMEKFGLYLKTNSFKELMDKVLKKNGKEHQDRCHKNGYIPYPTHTLQFIMDYASIHGEEVNEIPGKEQNDDYASIHFFEGYYFFNISLHTGVTKVYDKDCNLLVWIS